MPESFFNTSHQSPFEPDGSVQPPYEQLVSKDFGFAMTEGGLFFEGRSKLQKTLRQIAKHLDELEIPYALAGALALSSHGFARFTDDIDMIVNAEGLARLHHELDGRGYLPLFSKSKNLRDTETGVKIEFILSGGFPGDGKPKPVAFPDPSAVAELRDGIRCVNLPTLVELKLASGMTAPARLKDLADVQELIRALALTQQFRDCLNPYVREKYDELWRDVTTDQSNSV